MLGFLGSSEPELPPLRPARRGSHVPAGEGRAPPPRHHEPSPGAAASFAPIVESVFPSHFDSIDNLKRESVSS